MPVLPEWIEHYGMNRHKFATLKNAGDRLAAQTFEEELFAYRAFLINVLTEPHMDHLDWTKGWAWLTPFGNYTGGLLCIPLLKRKIPFQLGGAGNGLAWLRSSNGEFLERIHQACASGTLNPPFLRGRVSLIYQTNSIPVLNPIPSNPSHS
jgi:hypothetical protein